MKMSEKQKQELNDKLTTISECVVIQIHQAVSELNLDAEQTIRCVGFVIEKVKKANDYANVQMGIKSLNLE